MRTLVETVKKSQMTTDIFIQYIEGSPFHKDSVAMLRPNEFMKWTKIGTLIVFGHLHQNLYFNLPAEGSPFQGGGLEILLSSKERDEKVPWSS